MVYLLLRAAVGVLGMLPEPVMRRMGELGGLIWYRTAGGRRAMARRHMERLEHPDPTAAARDVFRSYGRYWAETFWVRRRRFPEMRARMEARGLDHIRAIQATGSGLVLALPHLGNWEAAALMGEELDLPLVAVAEQLANPHITRWFTEQRRMFGIEIVLTGSRSASRRALAEALDEGKGVALLCDRDLGGRGVPVRFFGEDTTMPAGPLTLALRAGVPVVPVGAYFDEHGGHRIVVEEPMDLPEPTDFKAAVAEGTQDLAEQLEVIIRRDPTQWHLVQPNWPSDREAPSEETVRGGGGG